MKTFIFLTCAALMITPATAKIKRSASAIADFKRANPCPANSARRGKCPGWVIDHIEPLCAGGADLPSNMQWQTVAESKAKDVLERQQCAALRRKHAGD